MVNLIKQLRMPLDHETTMALPSLDRSFIITAWLESILYGMHPVSGQRKVGY